MIKRFLDPLALVALLSVLAACTGPGTAPTTRMTVADTSVPGWLEGRWTMRDRFALSCTYVFTGTRLTGSATTFALDKPGYCTSAFSHVAGWRQAGRGLILTDADGARLVRLERQGRDAFAGRFRGGLLGSYDVVMRQGFH